MKTYTTEFLGETIDKRQNIQFWQVTQFGIITKTALFNKSFAQRFMLSTL